MVRVLCYNIRKGKGASGRSATAFRDLTEHFKTLDYDLVLTQEVFHPRAEGVHQSEALAASLGFEVRYEPNKHRRVGHHGNATLSRFNIEHAENFDLSTNPFEKRGCLYTRIELPTAQLHVFNVHLGLNQRQRLRQVRRIGELVEAIVPDNDPILLAGDFNDWNHQLETHVRAMGFENAFGDLACAPRTWPARRPLFKNDRIYCRSLSVREASCLEGDPWNELSDHLPLSAAVVLDAVDGPLEPASD